MLFFIFKIHRDKKKEKIKDKYKGLKLLKWKKINRKNMRILKIIIFFREMILEKIKS